MSAQPAASGGKVCMICGANVAKKPRVKDELGRYMCEGMCEQAARERNRAAAAKAAAPKPASARPVEPPPLVEDDDMMANLLDDAPAASTSACPGCGSAMPGGALVCMNCGYNARVGKAAKTKVIRTPVASQMPVPRRRANGEFGPSFGVLFLIVAGGISAVAAMGILHPAFCGLALLAAVLVHFVGHVWGIVSAFREDETGWGVCGILSFFVPLVGLFFLFYMLARNTDKWSKSLFAGGLVAAVAALCVLFAVMEPEQFKQLGTP